MYGLRTMGIGMLLTLVGCAMPQNGKDSYALSFPASGCGTADGATVLMDTGWTLELWFRGAPTDTSTPHPLITLGTMVELWIAGDGLGFSSPSAPRLSGWASGLEVFDGETHHISASWNPQTGGQIHADGLRTGSGQDWDRIHAFDTITLGCTGEDGAEYAIDEVRLSSIPRYPKDFIIPDSSFLVDEDTVGLWHLDEGRGRKLEEETGHWTGQVDDVEWVDPLLTH